MVGRTKEYGKPQGQESNLKIWLEPNVGQYELGLYKLPITNLATAARIYWDFPLACLGFEESKIVLSFNEAAKKDEVDKESELKKLLRQS